MIALFLVSTWWGTPAASAASAASAVSAASAASAASALEGDPDRDAHRLDVTWSNASATTGQMLVVDIAVAAALEPIVTLEVTLDNEHGIWFPTSTDRRRCRALIPIPVDAPAGARQLHIEATLQDGHAARFIKPVAVKAGAYEHRHIKVSRHFTSPSKEQQRRAHAEAEVLAAALMKTSSTRLWRGSFLRPTAGVVTSPFGTLRTYNKKKKSRHLGLDLDGDVGAPIVAPNRGRVLLAGERYYSGGTVVLDHGQGFITMYFHMSRIDVVDGQLVEPGEQLGAVGASGQVTGPHLHWTVKLDGHAVDPTQLLALDLSMDQGPITLQDAMP